MTATDHLQGTAGPGGARLALIVLACAYFFIGVSSLSVVGLQPQMSRDLNADAPAIAALVTIFAVVYALAAPGLQAVIGGFQRRWIIGAGLLLVSGSCALSAIAPTHEIVAASRVTMGLGCALIGPTASAAGAALVSPDRRSAALAAVFTGLTVATVMGVPLASYLGQTIGWRWAWGLIGASALVAAPLAVWSLGPANRGERATLSAFLNVLGDRALSLSILTTAAQLCAQFTTYALIAAWLVQYMSAPESAVPTALFLFGIGGVAGNLIGPRVERAIGAERTVQLCLVAVCLSFLTLWLMPAWWVAAVVVMFVWSAGGLMVMAPLQTRLVRLGPDRTGLSLALNAAAIYVGMSVGALISGTAYDLFGVAVLPLVSAAIMLGAFLIFRASMVR